MCDLQAIIEFTIELNKFVNVDLFQRGFYQIRVSHKVATKLIHKVEVNFCETQSLSYSPKSSTSDLSNGSNNIVFPPCIVNGAAVSKTFQVMYKNEEIALNDVITFKTHIIVDASQCIEQINNTVFLLDIELWFSDQNFGPQHHNTIERVSARQLTMHFDVCRGLHYSLPVIFDYFHLSAVTVTIHSSLITLCQPFLKIKHKNVNGKGVQSTSSYNLSCSYDTLLFGCSLSTLNSELSKNSLDVLSLRLRRAQLIHWQLCSILLTAILSLHRKLREYIHLLPPWTQAKCQSIDMNLRFDTLSGLGQRCYKDCLDISMKSSSFHLISYQNETNSKNAGLEPYSEPQVKPEDIVATVESDVSYLCGTAIIVWQQFLKVVLHNEKINQHLAKVHHLQRIKRFSEAFFAIEKQRHQICAICDNNSVLFTEISEALRKSSYLAKLPHCDVECVLTDGDISTLPVIYEEKFDPDLDLSERCSASLSDIRLDETCSRALQKSNSECIYPQKKNLKEKLFNNLTRMNLGYGRLKEEFSPCDRYSSSHSNLAFVDRKYFSELKRKQRANDLKESCTLVAFKKYDDFCGKRKSKVKETFSLYNLQTSNSKSMTTSESLPDLSSNHRNSNSSVEDSMSPSSTTSCPVTSAQTNSTNKWRSIISRKLLKPPPKFRDEKNKISGNSLFSETSTAIQC
ncbi:hypothetical protein B4U80_08011 [Leptotrombidium deliense]|uniref:Uncharacterized protein n=1 Tax=Leptotrombidium deliense TaxID=299467 RepID=A0A443SGL1_9ACAR|nr:hypothetical protein B4U80_08011 [Leptotrombidium deliense]